MHRLIHVVVQKYSACYVQINELLDTENNAVSAEALAEANEVYNLINYVPLVGRISLLFERYLDGVDVSGVDSGVTLPRRGLELGPGC